MRVLVCGGREFHDQFRVHSVLSRLHATRGPVTVLMQGYAKGADWLARQWAKLHGIEVLDFPADWDTHGDAAGPTRNAQMLREGKPDLVVSFPGWKGTRNMIAQAVAAGLEVIQG